ncbi:carbohydrate-binding protein [Abyssalbus ytuae]|uniref:Carbohydrate-binding protein n=1 Tax=Abyssalbus ytuae TaxID=2926907 RepID=A0A9E6ZQ03_9FLAO|nr:carbohydrate-binding protein [Abyssalbus ytuae]UOB18380.1 carbohydrate-binding protein [Abyssalbus ytuae]
MKTIIYRKVLLIMFFMVGSYLFSQDWTLVWQDEFNGSISSDWVFETGNGNSGWGNNELQYYRQENATVENGSLVITARHESYGGYNYTSARMKTQGRKSWKYGKIEARIAMPSFMGSWPAFWMLGDNISSVGWPACGEIDIMEHINTEAQTHGTIHWEDHNALYANYSDATPVNPVTDYHIYTVEWDEAAIKWFVDGNLFHEANISGGINGTGEFHNNFFILLNMAIGGNWPGFNIDNNAFPATMRVDYVRVYQKGGSNPNPTGVVTLYQHCPYDGYAIGLSEGSYTLSQLQAMGMSDNAISSIKVQSGYKATLYDGDNFTGDSLVKTSDDDCIDDDGFNDRLTSVIVSANTTGGSTVIEAENYSNMSGVQVEACTEGGENVGYIDAGDWMAYAGINFPVSGNYLIEYRVASESGGGVLSADLNAGATVLGQLNVPSTGGWQNWTTISHTVYVTAGTHAFGIYASAGGWNLNWIKITSVANSAAKATVAIKEVNAEESKSVEAYPVPTTNFLNIEGFSTGASVIIFDVSGKPVLETTLNKNMAVPAVDVTSLKAGTYILKDKQTGKSIRFTKK